ncbi:hypothetical protein K0U00_45845, partial [Paenibacillus sepulcri]|nr:hypothetical protein [Paenibacillus sepulcri]
EELRSLIDESIHSMSMKVPQAPQPKSRRKQAAASQESGQAGSWKGPDDQTLDLRLEDDLWYVYAGLNLEMVFETYDEAEQYLQEEGFEPS